MKVFTSLALIFFMFLGEFSLAEERVERPCQKSDLKGIWALSVAKNKGNVESSYQDLAQPYQIRFYGEDNSFKQLSSNTKLEESQLRELLSIPQNQTYKIENGVISTFNSNNQLLDRYECSYFYRDFPRGNIKAGTLSLLWLKNNEPYILNTYVRHNLIK